MPSKRKPATRRKKARKPLRLHPALSDRMSSLERLAKNSLAQHEEWRRRVGAVETRVSDLEGSQHRQMSAIYTILLLDEQVCIKIGVEPKIVRKIMAEWSLLPSIAQEKDLAAALAGGGDGHVE